jgi:SOS-response transcriptional repressor LexA
MSLTARQRLVLGFVAERLRSTGICPSIAEMMHALGLRSAGNVHAAIRQLEARGFLRTHPRRARSIEVLRLADDVGEGWLRAVSNGAMLRELARRGIAGEAPPAAPPAAPSRGRS